MIYVDLLRIICTPESAFQRAHEAVFFQVLYFYILGHRHFTIL